VTTTTDPSSRRADLLAMDHRTNPVDAVVPVGGGSVEGLACHCTSAELLGLRVQHPAVGVCVVAVEGEVDTLTAPLLDACLREQIAGVPTHLIVDLQPVRFLGSAGLNCLLQARELAQQTTRVHLHLAGLVTRVVARALEVTGLRERFDTYPFVTDALTALTASTQATIHTEQVGLLSVIGQLDDTGLTQLRRQLQVLFDTDTQYLVVNLARVTSCDHRLFDVLIWVHRFLCARRGWMRLVGVSPTVCNALDEATPSEWLLLHQASDWTGDLAG
jgi:anti-sigma B factor antagonist